MNEVTNVAPLSASFLTVGHSLKISLTLAGQKAMYGSTLLGWKDHAWLLCEWPTQLGHDAAIPKGTPCTVSYLHDGKLVGYRSDIRELVSAPVPLLFLAFPEKVEEMHLRKHQRVTSCEPALLIRTDAQSASASAIFGSDYAGGMVKDLSAGGCSIAVVTRPSWLRPGVTIRLEFELPGLGHVTNLSASVKSSVVREGTEMLGLAFQFDGLEYIEYRGWGGSVQQAIEQCVVQKHGPTELRALG
jgi:c-di-GMP-binding flagellar brake protein YcgR